MKGHQLVVLVEPIGRCRPGTTGSRGHAGPVALAVEREVVAGPDLADLPASVPGGLSEV